MKLSVRAGCRCVRSVLLSVCIRRVSVGVRALCERATADMRCRIRILDLGFESIFGPGQGLVRRAQTEGLSFGTHKKHRQRALTLADGAWLL